MARAVKMVIFVEDSLKRWTMITMAKQHRAKSKKDSKKTNLILAIAMGVIFVPLGASALLLAIKLDFYLLLVFAIPFLLAPLLAYFMGDSDGSIAGPVDGHSEGDDGIPIHRKKAEKKPEVDSVREEIYRQQDEARDILEDMYSMRVSTSDASMKDNFDWDRKVDYDTDGGDSW